VARWFPDPVEIPLSDIIEMIGRLETVVVELERLGQEHLAFAVHGETRRLLDYVIPEEDGTS
jgi:hypothetical protein